VRRGSFTRNQNVNPVVAVGTPEAQSIGQFNAARKKAVSILSFPEKLGLRDLTANLLGTLADNNPALKLSKDLASHSRANPK